MPPKTKTKPKQVPKAEAEPKPEQKTDPGEGGAFLSKPPVSQIDGVSTGQIGYKDLGRPTPRNIRHRKPSLQEIALVDSPVIKCTFLNLDAPGADIRFVYGGRRLHYEHGKQYMMPLCIVDHLTKNCSNPITEEKDDPETGETKTTVVGHTPRFSCTPVDLSALAGAKKT